MVQEPGGPHPELPAKVAHGCQCGGWDVERAGVIAGTTWGTEAQQMQGGRGQHGVSIDSVQGERAEGGGQGAVIETVVAKLNQNGAEDAA